METTIWSLGFRVSQNWRYIFGGPHDKDYSILGFIEVPICRKLPYGVPFWGCTSSGSKFGA